MGFTLRKHSNSGTVGLDIDASYLAAAQVADGRVVRGASVDLPEGIVQDAEVADAEALAKYLKRLVADAGLPRNVRLGVANEQIVVRVIEWPRIDDKKQLEAAVRFQSAEAIAMPLDEAVLDHQLAGYAESLDGTTRMQVVVSRHGARAPTIDGRAGSAASNSSRPPSPGRQRSTAGTGSDTSTNAPSPTSTWRTATSTATACSTVTTTRTATT